jgi:GxxExxY protein
MLEHERLTGEIIGAAIAVHKQLGPGFLETVYENALCLELQRRCIPFVRQLAVPVMYRGVRIGMHRIDLFVADEIVVELKAVNCFDDIHFVTVRSHLQALNESFGLLLNFANTTLQVKRVACGPNQNSKKPRNSKTTVSP